MWRFGWSKPHLIGLGIIELNEPKPTKMTAATQSY